MLILHWRNIRNLLELKDILDLGYELLELQELIEELPKHLELGEELLDLLGPGVGGRDRTNVVVVVVVQGAPDKRLLVLV